MTCWCVTERFARVEWRVDLDAKVQCYKKCHKKCHTEGAAEVTKAGTKVSGIFLWVTRVIEHNNLSSLKITDINLNLFLFIDLTH